MEKKLNKNQENQSVDFLALAQEAQFGSNNSDSKRDIYCYQNSWIGQTLENLGSMSRTRKAMRENVQNYAKKYFRANSEQEKNAIKQEFLKIFGSSFLSLSKLTNSKNEILVHKFSKILVEK